MEIHDLSKRMVSGFVSLTARRVILLAISFATINLLLARILPVSVIGVFNIANSILAFFTFFSDIGLAAAIIQKKEITQDDLKTTFTIQEILALLITLIVWFGAPILAPMYKLDEMGMWLIRSLGVGFFLTSLKVIPSVLLERELKFRPLVWVEILETLCFNGLLIVLVWSGRGVEAFAWATILRGLVGVGVIYIVAPWKMALGLSKNAAKSLLSFGLPFQLNSLLALLKDRLVPLVIAQMVGSVGVGYISWAQSLAFLPLEVMNIMIRVTFPAYSRLQDNEEVLKKTIEKTLFMTTFFLYPMMFGLMAIFPSLITHVVSSKWLPASPLFYLFSVTTFWATLSSPFTNVFNAIGKIHITLKLMVMWTVLTWILSPVLTIQFGFTGVAIASAIISFTSIIPMLIVRKMLKVKVIRSVWQPFIAAALMAVPTYFLAQILATNFITLLGVCLIGGCFYFGLMFLLAREKMSNFGLKFNN